MSSKIPLRVRLVRPSWKSSKQQMDGQFILPLTALFDIALPGTFVHWHVRYEFIICAKHMRKMTTYCCNPRGTPTRQHLRISATIHCAATVCIPTCYPSLEPYTTP